MFDCFDTIHGALQVTTGVMSTLKVSLVLLLLFVLLLLSRLRGRDNDNIKRGPVPTQQDCSFSTNTQIIWLCDLKASCDAYLPSLVVQAEGDLSVGQISCVVVLCC